MYRFWNDCYSAHLLIQGLWIGRERVWWIVLFSDHLNYKFCGEFGLGFEMTSVVYGGGSPHSFMDLYVGLLANRPEKCLVQRNFSEVVIRWCHKLHPSLPKYLTDYQTWTKPRIVPRVLDLWTTLQVSRSSSPPSMTLECGCIRRLHRVFSTILSSECLPWDDNLLGWFDCAQWSVCIIKVTDCERCICDVSDFSRPWHFQQRDLPISS